ncbi:MAG: LysM peptidoglycan-binding domain-containing protein [Chloroflexi bacterium]|nr:LysM peptidoglycan-binding domain-containing protein [Chloroflexota bacterium]
MFPRTFTQISVLVLLLFTSLGVPGMAQAGGVCGGTYSVDPGDTFAKIASMCGTSVSAIKAANPGIVEPLHTGQTLTLPGSNYNAPGTPTSVTYTPNNYSGAYTVQLSDTFSGIASRYGVTIQMLWAANPQIRDINLLYVGQIIYVPASSSNIFTPVTTKEPVPLSHGSVPAGTPRGEIELINKAHGDVYVSLQGTTKDGYHVIYEYPVSGPVHTRIPAGWYTYVAWVGGLKFEGQFKLGADGTRTITFYASKVAVE